MSAAGAAPPFEELLSQLRGALRANTDGAAVRAALLRHGSPSSPLRGGLPALASWLRARSARLAGVPPSPTSVYAALAVALFGDELDSAAMRQRAWDLETVAMDTAYRAARELREDARERCNDFMALSALVSNKGDPKVSLLAVACALGVEAHVLRFRLDGSVSFETVGDARAGLARKQVVLCFSEVGGGGGAASYAVDAVLFAPDAVLSGGGAAAQLSGALAPSAERSQPPPAVLSPFASQVNALEMGSAALSPAKRPRGSWLGDPDTPAPARARAVPPEAGAFVAPGGESAAPTRLEDRSCADWSAILQLRDDTPAAPAQEVLSGALALLAQYDALHTAANPSGGAGTLDAAVAEAREKLQREMHTLEKALQDARRVVVVGSEGAGKSSTVSRLCLHVLATDAELARIAADGGDVKLQTETLERWDDGECDESWFADDLDGKDDALFATKQRLFKHSNLDLLPAGGASSVTALPTTVVLRAGQAPQIVFRYKAAADVRKLYDDVAALQAHFAARDEDVDSDDSEDEAEAEAMDATGDAAAADLPSLELTRGCAEATFSLNVQSARFSGGGDDGIVRQLTADDMALPRRLRAWLGHTRTVHLRHTSRNDLRAAVLHELLRHTVGAWSRWGALEEVRIYLPSNPAVCPHELTLVDVPGYNTMNAFQRQAQQSAFAGGAFATLMQVLKPREEEHELHKEMLADTELDRLVYKPLMSQKEPAGEDFALLPLCSLDHAVRNITAQDAVRDLQAACDAIRDQMEKLPAHAAKMWRNGMQVYAQQSLQLSEKKAKLRAAAAVAAAAAHTPMVINCNPAMLRKALKHAKESAPPDDVAAALEQCNLRHLLAQLGANAREFERRAAARAVQNVLDVVLAPLAQASEQLLTGVCQLDDAAAEELRKRVQHARAHWLPRLSECVTSAFEVTVRPRLVALAAAASAGREAVEREASRNVIRERFAKDCGTKFRRYGKGSRLLLPDIRCSQPEKTLLNCLLLGHGCQQFVATVASAAAEQLPELFFAPAGRAARGSHAASATRPASSFEALVRDVVFAALGSHLTSAVQAGSADGMNLEGVIALTQERFSAELRGGLSSVARDVAEQLDARALDRAVCDIVRTTLLATTHDPKVMRARGNKPRIEAAARAVSCNNTTEEGPAALLKLHVDRQLKWLEVTAQERVRAAVVSALDGLAAANPEATLGASPEVARARVLSSRLCHLLAALLAEQPQLSCGDALRHVAQSRAALPLEQPPADRGAATESDAQRRARLEQQQREACAAMPAPQERAHRECVICDRGNFSKGSYTIDFGRGPLVACWICYGKHRKGTLQMPWWHCRWLQNCRRRPVDDDSD